MSQLGEVGDLAQSVGYTLKQAAVALRSAIDSRLRPLGLTTPQYSCLEVLGQRPGLSSSELARATFVTRQSMNVLMRALQERGLVTRSASAPQGRTRPVELTAAGRAQLAAASSAVRAVEDQMLGTLTDRARHRLRSDLASCVVSLSGTSLRG